MKIFLDDERKVETIYPNDSSMDWIVTKNYEQFIKEVQRKFPNFVSFDHDLADEHYVALIESKGSQDDFDIRAKSFKEKTGLTCAQWLVDYCIENNLDFPEYNVHSFNPIGKENIQSYIQSYLKSIGKENLRSKAYYLNYEE